MLLAILEEEYRYPVRLRNLIKGVLERYDLPASSDVIELMIGTAAHESHMGRWMKQINGPAMGLFQMEPDTLQDIKDNYLAYRPNLIPATLLDTEDFMDRIDLQIIYCRLHYLRSRGSIPNTLTGQAKYYKRHYNTYKGKATVESYLDNYKRLIKD